MRIKVSDPLSPRAALVVALLCVLAFIGVVVAGQKLRPYLDSLDRQMIERRLAIEKVTEGRTRKYSLEYERDRYGSVESPDPTSGKK